jgi:hypothetical protein
MDNLDATISSRADQNPPSQTLDDYKASGFAPAGEYDTEMSRIDVVVSTRSSHGEPDLSNLDVAVGTRSSHSVSDVWAHATRTLTSFGTLVADIWSSISRTITGEVTTDAASREASKATGFSIPGEYDSVIADIQADLDNPDQYKATGFATQNPPSLILADYKADVAGLLSLIEDIVKLTGHNVSKSGDIITIYESDGVTLWRRYDLSSGGRVQL